MDAHVEGDDDAGGVVGGELDAGAEEPVEVRALRREPGACAAENRATAMRLTSRNKTGGVDRSGKSSRRRDLFARRGRCAPSSRRRGARGWSRRTAACSPPGRRGAFPPGGEARPRRPLAGTTPPSPQRRRPRKPWWNKPLSCTTTALRKLCCCTEPRAPCSSRCLSLLLPIAS